MNPFRLSLAVLAAGSCAQAVHARDGLDLSGVYIADVSATLSGGADRKVRYLDNLELDLDADLGRLWSVPDTVVHLAVIGNFGLRPNDSAGSLEGVDNIEVSRSAVRLFEAWAEKGLPFGSVRLGLYDLNSEFYVNDSSALLIGPPFGIGSEISATGSNGPSVFPSSALAARLRIATRGVHAQFALINARAQTLGDPGGINFGFGKGLVAIGEIGAGNRLRASLGAWTYTRPADALFEIDAAGDPLRERPAGIYGTVEAHLAREEAHDLAVFLRGGVARGRSQPFTASLQAGLFAAPALAGRKDSAFSLGFHMARTSADFRAAQAAAGGEPWQEERGIEVTYADMVLPGLTVQPDLQLIERRSATARSPLAVQATLRMQFAF